MHFSKHVLKILLCYLIYFNVNSKIIRRHIIYPKPGSKIQLIFGAGFPAPIEYPGITIGYVFKCDYRLPQNISDFSSDVIKARKKRETTRIKWKLYSMLSQFLIKFGGKACVLRTICELAFKPLDKDYGFMEEILHLVFTPSITQDDSMDKEYLAAEHIGKTKKRTCSVFFPECALNLIDLFTKWI